MSAGDGVLEASCNVGKGSAWLRVGSVVAKYIWTYMARCLLCEWL